MPKTNIITALDIGTDSIKGLTAFQKQNSSDFEILSYVKKFSLGIRRGVVVNPDEVSKNISHVLSDLETESGQKITSVYVNLGGSHIFCVSSHGSVVVSRADQKISQEDIDRVIESAKTFSLSHNNEILEIFPNEYTIDNQTGIKQALGMSGVRLEVQSLVICGFSLYLKNLTESVLDAGVQIEDIIPSPLAAAKAVLKPQQKELGVMVVDIGAGTTSIAVYKEGDLIHTAIIPIGSLNITQDIAVGLQADIEIAEKIKKKFGSCILTNADKNKKEKITLDDSSCLSFSHKMLIKFIEPRVSEIFDLIQRELKKISPQPLLPAGVVITGGGAKLPKILDIAKNILKLPARISAPQNFSNLETDVSMSAVCGLILEGAESDKSDKQRILQDFAFGNKIIEKIKKVFKAFIP